MADYEIFELGQASAALEGGCEGQSLRRSFGSARTVNGVTNNKVKILHALTRRWGNCHQ